MAILKTFLCVCNTRTGSLMCGCYTLVGLLDVTLVSSTFFMSLLLSLCFIHRKNPKNSDTENIVVIILKFEQRGFTIEKCVQM